MHAISKVKNPCSKAPPVLIPPGIPIFISKGHRNLIPCFVSISKIIWLNIPSNMPNLIDSGHGVLLKSKMAKTKNIRL